VEGRAFGNIWLAKMHRHDKNYDVAQGIADYELQAMKKRRCCALLTPDWRCQ
jgi:hypothetical protein